MDVSFHDPAKTSRPQLKEMPKSSVLNMDEIMKNLDCKITRLEKLNMRVQKIDEVSQKEKVKLQDLEGEDVSIVNRMTGDPREIIHGKREEYRNKSRTDAKRAALNSTTNRDIKK